MSRASRRAAAAAAAAAAAPAAVVAPPAAVVAPAAPAAVVTPIPAPPAAVVQEPVVVVRHRRMGVDMARWSTILLIIFTILIPFLGNFDRTGALTHFLNERLHIVFMAYIGVQFFETANRPSTDRQGWFEDNGLAFIGILVAIIFFVLLTVRWLRMNEEQVNILIQCFGWGTVDFVLGLVLSNRIAFSPRERDEE